MAFFHGVLESVKNENEVTTYDKYIMPETNRLENVLDTLNKNIGSGRAGLAASVEQVKRWLEKYNDEVGKKTKAVTEPINVVKTLVKHDITLIEEEKNNNLKKQVGDWTRRAKLYMEKATDANKALEAVDSKLKDKLKCPIHMLLQATKIFREEAGNGDLRDIYDTSQSMWVKVTSQIETIVQINNEKLRGHLKYYIERLHIKLESLRDTQFKELGVFVAGDLKDGFDKVNDAIRGLENRYKGEIISKLQAILPRSNQFKLDFAATTAALGAAIDHVERDIGKLVDLSTIKTFSEYSDKLSFLRTIGENNNAFEFLSEYFDKLDVVMALVTAAMTALGEGFGAVGTTSSRTEIAFGLEKSKIQLKKLQGINEQIPSFQETRLKLQSILGEKFTVSEDLKDKLTDVAGEIDELIQNLDTSSLSNVDSQAKLQTLLTSLGHIALCVSDHYKEVFTAVMMTINNKLNGEIREVASAMKNKICECQTVVTNSRGKVGPRYIKGLKSFTDPVYGLAKLLSDFGNKIDGELESLQKGVGTERDDVKGSSVCSDLQQLRVHIGELGEQINGLSIRVTALSSQLYKCIDDAFTLLSNAPQWVDSIMQKLRVDVSRRIDVAFKEVQEKTRTAYAERKRIEVGALQQCVELQFGDINRIISADLPSGMKGLLNTLSKKITTLDNLAREDNKAKLTNACPTLQRYLTDIHKYIRSQIDEPEHLRRPLSHLHLYVDPLLESLTIHNFDHRFTKNLDELLKYVTQMRPRSLAEPSNPLAEALKEGLMAFGGELGKAYVNRYSGASFTDYLVEVNLKLKDDAQSDDTLTGYGRKCAKAFLTLIPLMCHDVSDLRSKCVANWKTLLTNLRGKNNSLGACLQEAGYKVSESDTVHNGELRNTMNGQNVHEKLKRTIPGAKDLDNVNAWIVNEHNRKHGDENKITIVDIFDYLHYCLKGYYEVCHLGTFGSKKHPRSIYDMLQWLSGLSYNPVHQELALNGFSDLFEKPKKDESDAELSLSDEDPDTLEAYPENVTATKLSNDLRDVCAYSETVLVAIQGYGHAGGRYACDFNSNADSFVYPSDPAKCLEILADVLTRVYEQLCFLLVQCSREYEANSWRDCYYGRGVGGSSWTCNTKQCPNQIGDETCDHAVKEMANQSADHNGDQKDDQQPKCGVKSPLQSFLEDGLPGFLPHTFDKVGCKLECTVSKHRGLPCKTPMGFADISNVASHTKQGAHLTKVLYDFCGHMDSPLVKLCGNLVCVLNRPPQTLSDMYAFYYNLLHDWNGKSKGAVDVRKHKMTAFNDAVTRANFGVPYPALNVHSIITDHKSNNHTNGDLMCLYSCNSSTSSTATCGRYLHPFSMNTWTTFSEKHADKYLSWIVYLTETFYSLLEKLLEECCQNCTSTQSRCNGKVCPKTCPVKYTSDKTRSQPVPDPHHTKDCKSIAYCPSTRPTLCKYGFVFKSLSNMSGTSGEVTKRTCRDLCHALQNVLLKGKVLGEFTHVTIPEFLWNIRSKFFWLNVALWSLSLFYLICVIVGRLDVLHIKSHLHSPSSHRIAAQSLLAAGRVNKLNRVFYLQP